MCGGLSFWFIVLHLKPPLKVVYRLVHHSEILEFELDVVAEGNYWVVFFGEVW